MFPDINTTFHKRSFAGYKNGGIHYSLAYPGALGIRAFSLKTKSVPPGFFSYHACTVVLPVEIPRGEEGTLTLDTHSNWRKIVSEPARLYRIKPALSFERAIKDRFY